jgi:hypothetical protein
MFYFPMAGLSSRFRNQGYKKPKYYLDVGDINLFQASLMGFSKYFESDEFCFIYLDKFVDETTIRNWTDEIGLSKSSCITIPLSNPTLGQADTVRLAMQKLRSLDLKNDEVYIFNIDTIYHNFKKANFDFGPFLDVTCLPGNHWSFIQPSQNEAGRVVRVVEKSRISEYCSVGLYQFQSGFQYLEAHHATYSNMKDKEQYVAPIYQSIIDCGEIVRFRQFPPENFDFLGTPKEYDEFIKKNQLKLQ